MNQVARLSIVIFGIYWIVSGLASIGGSSVEFLQFRDLYDEPGWVTSWLSHLGVATIAVSLTAVLPGLVLIGVSRRVSDKLFPQELPSPPLTASGAYVVGCTLLAFFFMIGGGASLIAGVVQTAMSAISSSDEVRSAFLGRGPAHVASGAVQLLLGFTLYRHALRSPDRSG